ncbi:MAG TPA: cation:proton antiporter [Nitrososphaeria archaeon]|nr:MAG: hypothetical protein DRN68_07370 [Nitrososphaerota archaeon]HDJ66820.1 cation:proton antiporter [Nitrososphaeria archaeon]
MAAEAVISGMDPIMRAIVTISVLIFFAKIFASVFSSLRLPSVIGELFAGIVLGPYALGTGIKVFGEPLVVLNDYVDAFAEIGVIMILFSAGLEMGLASLRKAGGWAFLIAFTESMLSFIVGYQIFIYLGYPQPVALVVATSLVATSLAVSVRILEDFHALTTDEGTLLINAAVIDDVLSVIILAVISSLTIKGTMVLNVYAAVRTAVIFFILWGLMLMISAYILPRMIEQMTMLKAEGAVEAAAIGSAFIMAALAGALGLSPVIGSYAAGMAVAESKALARIKEFIRHINQIFSPVFFTVMGAKINLTLFNDQILFGMVILTVIAFSLKFAGSFSTSILKLKDVSKGIRVGIGMVPRGELSIVIASIALTSNIISDAIYMEIVGMVILTSLTSSLLLSKLYEAVPTEAEAVLE